jgi:hypothetical protein
MFYVVEVNYESNEKGNGEDISYVTGLAEEQVHI